MSEPKWVRCPDCDYDDPDPACGRCDGTGEMHPDDDREPDWR